jgi:hypothetical protein
MKWLSCVALRRFAHGLDAERCARDHQSTYVQQFRETIARVFRHKQFPR